MSALRNPLVRRLLLALSMLGLAAGCNGRPFAKARRSTKEADAAVPSGQVPAMPANAGSRDSRQELDELLSIQ